MSEQARAEETAPAVKFTTATEIEIYELALSEKEVSFIIDQFTHFLQRSPESIIWGQKYGYDKHLKFTQDIENAHITFTFLKYTDSHTSPCITCTCPDDSSVIEQVIAHFKKHDLITGIYSIPDSNYTKVALSVYFPK
jgi:hypothetical protein